MKAAIVDMDQKEPNKATQPLQVSTSLHHCSNIYRKTIVRSKAFILTWIDFKYDRAKTLKRQRLT